MTLSMALAVQRTNSGLVAGMMDKNNLLDLIRTFTLFSTDDKGQTIKICRDAISSSARSNSRLSVSLKAQLRGNVAVSSGILKAQANR